MADGYEIAIGNRFVIQSGTTNLEGWSGAPDDTILATDNEGYPFLVFYGRIDQTTSTNQTPSGIYARPLNLISTNDGEVPGDDNLQIYLGSIVLGDSISYEYFTHEMLFPRPHFDCDIYIHNESGSRWDFLDLYCYTATYRRIQ